MVRPRFYDNFCIGGSWDGGRQAAHYLPALWAQKRIPVSGACRRRTADMPIMQCETHPARTYVEGHMR